MDENIYQRKKIKFRQRKFGKEKAAKEFITEFEDFMYTLRFDFFHLERMMGLMEGMLYGEGSHQNDVIAWTKYPCPL